MKNLVVLSLFVCFVAYANAAAAKSSSSSSAEENIKELAQALKEKFNTTILLDMISLGDKIKEKCPDIETKIETTMDQVGECLEDIELGSDTFCSLIRKNFEKCSKPARDLVESCMPTESKDLPQLVEKMIMAVLDQACSSTVEEMLELLNPCKFEKDPSTLPVCQEVKTTIDQHKNQLPTKSLICHTLPKMRNCIKSMVEESCKNDVTKQAHMKMHNAIDKALKDECDAVNKV